MSSASSISRAPVVIQHRAAGGIAVIAFNRVDGPNTLKGFADLHIAGWRLRILGCPAHANVNGARWVGLPGKPMTDKAGMPLRDAAGRIRYLQALAFDDSETLRRFSDAAVEALDLYSPGWSMSGDLSFAELERLVDHRLGIFDVICPQCSADRKAPANRRRKVLRIWHQTPDFVGYRCVRCDLRGSAHRAGFAGGGYSRLVGTRQSAVPMKPDPVRYAGEANPAERIRRAHAIWSEAEPIAFTGGAIASRYLVRRGVDLSALPNEMERVLRWHPRCPWGRGTTAPCMLALWTDTITGEPKAIHRTALTADAAKIGRLSLGPTAGCVIRLWPDEAVERGLVIGEGLETVLVAATRIEHKGTRLAPAWACGDDGHVAAFPVLAGIEALTILVDHDESGTGQAKAAKCAKRWQDAGREVTRLTPRIVGDDFNDIVEVGG